VDGLHQRAGSRDVVELHGSIMTWRGVRTGRPFELPEDELTDFPPAFDDGELARPGVVWFGEALPETALVAAFAAIESCDVFLSIGTSAVVYPAAGFADLAHQHGARIVEVNPEATPITGRVDVALAGKSGLILPRIVG
ncbi:MAG: Sir2 family NAD-dependent protein deacetylase, partial [Planctomycetota bacterium]